MLLPCTLLLLLQLCTVLLLLLPCTVLLLLLQLCAPYTPRCCRSN